MPKETSIILVVDLDEQVGRLAALVLDEEGFHVRYVKSIREALSFWDLLKHHIDLVLIDRSIPAIDREQFMSRLLVEKPSVRIVFTGPQTGAAAESSPWLNQGGNFLGKPFTYSELLEFVNRNLP